MHRPRLRRILLLLLAASLCGCTAQNCTVTSMTWTAPTELPQESIAHLAFPVTFPESNLIAEEIRYYEGAFWEDGSGDKVENVAALMVYNPTNRMVEFASFTIEQGGEHLYFFAYRLPPMSRCLVLEYHKKVLDPAQITACRQLSVRWERQEFSREQVGYVGIGPVMTIINRDVRTLSHVTVWYKQYVGAGDYYLGGTARSAHVFFIQPEERRTILPDGYEAGKARIVAIELEI